MMKIAQASNGVGSAKIDGFIRRWHFVNLNKYNSKNLVVLYASIFIVMTGYGITITILPFHIERMALNGGAKAEEIYIHVGALTGVFALMHFFSHRCGAFCPIGSDADQSFLSALVEQPFSMLFSDWDPAGPALGAWITDQFSAFGLGGSSLDSFSLSSGLRLFQEFAKRITKHIPD